MHESLKTQQLQARSVYHLLQSRNMGSLEPPHHLPHPETPKDVRNADLTVLFSKSELGGGAPCKVGHEVKEQLVSVMT